MEFPYADIVYPPVHEHASGPELDSFEIVLLGHARHDAVSMALYVFLEQLTQLLEEVAAVHGEYLPSGQLKQADEPFTFLKLPAAHASHSTPSNPVNPFQHVQFVENPLPTAE